MVIWYRHCSVKVKDSLSVKDDDNFFTNLKCNLYILLNLAVGNLQTMQIMATYMWYIAHRAPYVAVTHNNELTQAGRAQDNVVSNIEVLPSEILSDLFGIKLDLSMFKLKWELQSQSVTKFKSDCKDTSTTHTNLM